MKEIKQGVTKFIKKSPQKIHIYLSVFFFPLALLYALTGVLFLVGIYGEVGLKTYEVYMTKKLTQGELIDFTLDFMHKNKIEFPNMNIKTSHGRLQIGIMADFARINQSDGKIRIDVYQGDLLRYLMMLHFGAGRWYFDVLGVAFGSALAVFYFTGVWMVRNHSRRKTGLWFSFCLGLLVTVLAGYFSGR